jgi:hypothetical protein
MFIAGAVARTSPATGLIRNVEKLLATAPTSRS